MPELLFLSPYDGASHRYWRCSLMDYIAGEHPDWAQHALTMPARHFSWRQRGNSMGFALHNDLQGLRPDIIIATSVTDLSALRGLNRRLAQVPAAVYFPENQFAYPDTHGQGLVERQMTSIYTALSADEVLFNSEFNRSSFLAGAARLLKKMPDEVPPGVVEQIDNRSRVLPVALAAIEKGEAGSGGTIRIVWNHRWEHDKGPALLLEIVELLLAGDVDFRLSLLGEQFRRHPDELGRVIDRLNQSGTAGHIGYVDDRQDYLALLRQHDIVLSTAHQEFQGLSVQEAMLAGCVPVVPDRLSYPEYVPESYRYGNAVGAIALIRDVSREVPDTLGAYQWSEVGPQWIDIIEGLLRQR